jgi:signal transduction histidine kinase/DNA-binding response OmpR family regulator
MQPTRTNRSAIILEEIARGVNLDRTLGLIAEQVATEMGAPTCKIWVVKRGDVCERCSLAYACTNREICLHLVAASGAAFEKEYPRIPLSQFSAHMISQGGVSDFADPNGAGDKLFGLQHGANEGGRDCFVLSPLRGPSGILGLIGVFNHRQMDQSELLTLTRFVPSAVAAIRIAELQSRYDLLRAQADKQATEAEADLARAAERETELGHGVARLEEQASRLQSEITRLHSEREAVVLESVEAIRRAELLEEEMRSLRERADELMSLQQESGRAYSEWAAQIEGERNALDEKNTLLNERIKGLEEGVAELKSAGEETARMITERNLAIEGLRTELEIKQAELYDSRESINRLREEIASLEESHAALRGQNNAVTEGLDDLERSLRIAEDARARSEQIRVGLAAKVADLTVDIEKLRVENSRIVDENEQLVVEAERAKRELSGLRTHCERLGEENTLLKTSASQIGLSQSETESRLKALEQENAALVQTTTEMEEASKRFEAMTGRLEETTHRLRNRVEASERGRLEVEQRNRTLIEQNRRLQIESQANARFLANMSHELRTPMNAIIGFTSILLEDTGLQLSDRHRRNLERVSRNGKELLQLINNVLDLSKLDSGRMEVYSEAVEIRDIIERAVIVVEPLKHGRPLDVKIEVQDGIPTLRTDRTKLQQILINLLSNAVKFTPKGEIKISAESLDRDRVRIAVSDTGVGIAEQDIPKVFEEFRQLRAPGSAGGSGLGLTITLRMVELLGGDISVSSRVGEGSAFSIVIPISIEGRASGAADSELWPGDRTRSALVYDSNPATSYLMKKYLLETGYSVTATDDAARAIELVRNNAPAIVTVNSENLDGVYGLIETLGRDAMAMTPSRPECGVLIVVTSGDEGDRRALEAGASVVLRRPFERADLREAIERAKARNQKRMLVVDDDQDALDLVREALEGNGFEIRTAMDGRKVMRELEDWNPDIVLLDLMLPELDGFEVVHRMSLNPKWKSIPVILMTARDLTLEERRALGVSRPRLIQKGDFSRDELVAEIHAALSLKGDVADIENGGNAIAVEGFSHPGGPVNGVNGTVNGAGGPVNGVGEPVDDFGAGR